MSGVKRYVHERGGEEVACRVGERRRCVGRGRLSPMLHGGGVRCDEKNTGRMAVPARRISEGKGGGSAMMVVGLGIWRIRPAG